MPSTNHLSILKVTWQVQARELQSGYPALDVASALNQQERDRLKDALTSPKCRNRHDPETIGKIRGQGTHDNPPRVFLTITGCPNCSFEKLETNGTLLGAAVRNALRRLLGTKTRTVEVDYLMET